jgi:hypothetical protein
MEFKKLCCSNLVTARKEDSGEASLDSAMFGLENGCAAVTGAASGG